MLTVQNLRSELARRIECQNFGKFVRVTNSKDFCILPEKFTHEYMQKIKSMKVYEDDVWIITFPKCGTTWTQEMVWLLMNNLNCEEAQKTKLDERVPFVELSGLIFMQMPYPTFELTESLQRPRIIKTHLPVFLLPDEFWNVKSKIVYVARNPKDTATSYYHHHRNIHGWTGNKMEDFINAFVADKMLYSPMNEHVLKFWELRNEPNVHFIHFEDMKRNLPEVVKSTAKFLGKTFSDEEVERVCEHLSFDKMKVNKAVNKDHALEMVRQFTGVNDANYTFIRKGKVGSHKDELTSEEIELLSSYIKNIDEDKYDFTYKF